MIEEVTDNGRSRRLRFRVFGEEADGMSATIGAATMEAISRVTPEPISEHWVVVGGDLYPPKQVYQLITGLPRSAFTSHRALSELRKLGLQTSTYTPRGAPAATAETTVGSGALAHGEDLSESFSTLVRFLSDRDLTEHLASAEDALDRAHAEASADVVVEFGFTEDLLDAALAVRAHIGRLSDVIHATVIARVLPAILEPGERIARRPSLGAGNDRTRPYDLETDRRIAEFKVAQWKGADTMRKRGVVADMVHLALDESGRRAQLFVVGTLPVKFLRTSRSTIEWALGRSSPHTRARFHERFGPATSLTVADFTSSHGNHIEIVDLSALVPSLTLPPQLL
ncbi:hypothetical protein [Nocardia asteroides]|uniref:hypothetical protein n=1 Tax=Nocardia asteroides TaxID=1824 RepID=UPI001E30DC89|nr:hypothetical protein [Nocardia asteroides]UGT55207.1 hypothetical protein LTT85_32290 [Nocardia asteroides]